MRGAPEFQLPDIDKRTIPWGRPAGWGRRMVTALAIVLMVPVAALSQEVDVAVNSGFLPDSMKIGERVPYYLSARYPSTLTILFPDSTYAFTPFEYQSKEYFLTRTRDGISTDSTVYYLTTFEVDRVQHLSLPVFVAHGRDCTQVDSPRDSILITQLVAHVPDTVSVEALPLKENTAYERVSYDINVVFLLIGLTLVVAAALVVWVLFGKKIRNYFRIRRLRQKHERFLERYNALLSQLRAGFSSPATEAALATWKRYMEQLESKPYTKLTTKETQRLVGEPAIIQDLSRIDRAIYGHDKAVLEPLENLKRFANGKFHRKVKEVQHG